MRVPSRHFLLGLVLALAVHALGVERPAWLPAEAVVARQVQRQREQRGAALEFNRRLLAGEYARLGSAEAAWDAAARRALEAEARVRLGGDPDSEVLLAEALSECAAAGCNDPLIKFVHLDWAAKQKKAGDAGLRDAMMSACRELAASGYSPANRFHAMARLAQCTAIGDAMGPSEQDVAAAEGILDEAVKLLPAIAQMPGLPGCEMTRIMESSKGASRAVYSDSWRWTERVLGELEKHLPRNAELMAAKGRFFISYAWEARGDGWANTVTQDAWAKMRQRLDMAERTLTQAYRIDGQCLAAPVLMMNVELGQGHDREAMELWFRRAVEIDPYSLEAYEGKRAYLEGKWYGSQAEMLAFAREVAGILPKDEPARLVLKSAHESMARLNRAAPADAREVAKGYMAMNPEVWPELRTLADELMAGGRLSMKDRVDFAVLAISAEDRASARRYLEGVPERFGKSGWGELFSWAKSEAAE